MKAWSGRPWESVRRSEIELRTYLGVIVDRLLVADGFVLGWTECRVEYVRSVAGAVLDALLGSGRLKANDSGYEFPEEDVVRVWSWVMVESISGEIEHAEKDIISNFLRSEFHFDVNELIASMRFGVVHCCGNLKRLV